MERRAFLASCSTTALALQGAVRVHLPPADHQLRIAPYRLELSPRVTVNTIAYNDMVPGPLLRFRAGVPVTIDVQNDADHPEFVHWHGLHISAEMDGAMEQ